MTQQDIVEQILVVAYEVFYHLKNLCHSISQGLMINYYDCLLTFYSHSSSSKPEDIGGATGGQHRNEVCLGNL